MADHSFSGNRMQSTCDHVASGQTDRNVTGVRLHTPAGLRRSAQGKSYSVQDLLIYTAISALILTVMRPISWTAGCILIVMTGCLYVRSGGLVLVAYCTALIASILTSGSSSVSGGFFVSNAECRAILTAEIAAMIVLAFRWRRHCFDGCK
jgi:hypothetical protein